MTNEMPNSMSTPPAGGQDPRRRNMIIAIVVGVLLLCLCCCVLGVGFYLWRNGDTLLNNFSRLLPALTALA